MKQTLIDIRKLVEKLDDQVVDHGAKVLAEEDWKAITRDTPDSVLLLFDIGYGPDVGQAEWWDHRVSDNPNTWQVGDETVEDEEAIAWKPLPTPPDAATVELLKQQSNKGMS